MREAPGESDARTDDALDRRDAELARLGDAEAFRRLVQRRQAAVARQMWRFTRDQRQHEELVQEVFVNAFMSLRGYRGQGPFLHWLRRIAVRTGYAFWRRAHAARLERPLDAETIARLAAEPSEAAPEEAAEVVHRLVERLPPRDRAVIVLLHLEERSVAETAELLGWSRAMVKVQAWRARGRLRRMLAGTGIA
jgi:RNA polymerase sigma-70 factor (ECF subfamily)